MKITLHADAPAELVRIIDKIGKETLCVSEVHIDSYLPYPDPSNREDDPLALFDPMERIIYIDLGRCMSDLSWMKYGATLRANAWMNMLFATYHEFGHACQLSLDYTLRGKCATPDMENDANTAAYEEMKDYFLEGGEVPVLEEMGWAGEEIHKVLSNIHARAPHRVQEEINVMNTGAVANVETVVTSQPDFSNASAMLLRKEVDNGHIGERVGGMRYLTMCEFLETFNV